MSLLFFEPFDAYGVDTTAYRERVVSYSENWDFPFTSIGSAVGRPSGSVFIRINGNNTPVRLTAFTNTHSETITYLACYMASDNTEIGFRNNINQSLFTLYLTAASVTVRSDYNSTVRFTYSGSDVPQNFRWHFFEIRSVIDTTSGSVQLRNNGRLIFSASNINTNTQGGTQYFGMLAFKSFGDGIYFDDIIILNTTGSDWNAPIGNGNFFLASFVSSGSGFYSEMTGTGATPDFRTVNNIPRDNDTTFLSATTASFPQRETFTLRAVNSGSSIPLSASVAAFVKTSRVRSTNTDPTNTNHLIRLNGTDYTGSTPISGTLNYEYVRTSWMTNPEAARAWNGADIYNMEVGFQRDS
jgi:hypothetical protein